MADNIRNVLYATITAVALSACSPANPPAQEITGDFNKDGIADRVYIVEQNRKTYIMCDSGKVTSTLCIIPYSREVIGLDTGDWNNDGKTDIGIINDERGRERGMFSGREILYNVSLPGGPAAFSSQKPAKK